MTPADATDTKERILDAVEDLVGQHGCDGASVRMITEAAGVNIAAVNYHFGSKEDVLVAAAERIATSINSVRMQMLREAEDRYAPDALPVEELTRAMIEPAFRALSHAGDRAGPRARFGARICTAPSETLQERAHACFRESSDVVWDGLTQAHPEVSEGEMTVRYRAAITVMLSAIADIRNANVFATEKGWRTLLDHLVAFVSAGFTAPPTSTGK